MTDDWVWWNWLLFISGCVLSSVLGEWHVRKLNRKKEKFYGMEVRIDCTIELIEWTIDRWVARAVRNLTATLAFCFACWWAYRAVFGGG